MAPCAVRRGPSPLVVLCSLSGASADWLRPFLAEDDAPALRTTRTGGHVSL